MEQTAVPKAGWILYYDLFINKNKNAYTITNPGLLISTVTGQIAGPLIYEARSHCSVLGDLCTEKATWVK